MTQAERLCRLCLEHESNKTFARIIAKESKTASRIKSLTGIKVRDLRRVPALICEPCLKILYEADLFRLKCLEADEYFQRLEIELEQDDDRLSKQREEANLPERNSETNFKAEPTSARQFRSHPDDVVVINIKDTRLKVKAKKEKNAKRYRPICGFCGKEQESEYRLKQHELLSHTPINALSPDEVFVCDLCARIFKTKASMRNHFIRAHTPKNDVFPCHICGKVLPHQKALYAHERVHIKTEVTCQYCAKTFSRKVLLSSHIAIVHLKKRLSQCQYCPHQAITGGALKKHIRCKHLNLRQHQCDWPGCGKAFHENQHLVRHYRSHTNERPYECRNEGCGKAFSDHAKRSRHEKQNCPRRQTISCTADN